MSILWALVLPVLATQASPALVVKGAVRQEIKLTLEDLRSMPRVTIKASSHNIEGTFEGVSMREILTRAGVPAGESLRGGDLAKTVIVTGADGYKVAFGIAELDPAFTDRVVILADRKDGAPLGPNAAPFQVIVAGEKRPARWVRQVVSIEIVSPHP